MTRRTYELTIAQIAQIAQTFSTCNHLRWFSLHQHQCK